MRNKVRLIFRGMTFKSYTTACSALGVSHIAARQRVRKGQTWEEALECLLAKKAMKNPSDLHNAGKLPMKPYRPWHGPTE